MLGRVKEKSIMYMEYRKCICDNKFYKIRQDGKETKDGVFCKCSRFLKSVVVIKRRAEEEEEKKKKEILHTFN